jgi:hypothetical protein
VTAFEAWVSPDGDSLPIEPLPHQDMEKFCEAAIKFAKVMRIAPEYERLLNEAGFEALVHKILKV